MSSIWKVVTVDAEVVIASGFTMKFTGVSLVWDPKLIDENKIECESSLSPASSFDNDLFDDDSFDEDRSSERLRFTMQEQRPIHGR
ncbi:hypothetical protein RchiOBHm_Chr7g0233991 [Rosa chinensis]|uniref:Uncharacterized protein n=1 Tax=Rosa chinensis TaxID=74649 RepID=A0A2P6PGC6_ROSCH|nr:hypothetical protein RchiOBHm_Chr7g0233991 [Rosa chinensis]